MDNYLITGGAGFIGSHFVKLLMTKEPQANIFVLDKLTYAGNLDRINQVIVQDNITFVQGDICNKALVHQVIEDNKINKIINFAAESHVDKSIQGQQEFINTNVLGVQILLSVSKEIWSQKNIQEALFIQISTDEVYGSCSRERQEVFTEESPLKPQNPYAATKASAEHLVEAFKNTFNYPAIIVRSSNNYGVDQNKEKFIPMIINKLLEKQPITIYGDGLNKRNWLHVKDNCRAIYKIMTAGQLGEIYNIKGNQTIKNVNLAQYIIEQFEKAIKTSLPHSIVFVEDRLGHDYFYNISDQKLKQTIGFEHRYTFEEGIEEIIDYYLHSFTD
jgi:dTDP-glucose 4,6-dehydratase